MVEQESLQRKRLILRIIFQDPVQIVHISLKMPVMVQHHGSGIDIRLQGIVSIGERRVYKRIVFVQRLTCEVSALVYYM